MSDLGTICERHGDRAAGWVLQAPLSTLEAFVIETRCHCSASVQMPCRLLMQRHGPQHRLAAIIDRARCRHCKKPPSRIWLCENHSRNDARPGRNKGWSVQLRPLPALIDAEAAE